MAGKTFMFSCLFIQYKLAKGEIFTTVLKNDKLNPVTILQSIILPFKFDHL